MKELQQFEPKDRFLRINVFQFPLGNCGGVTDGLGQQCIYIPCPTGPTSYDEIDRKDLIFIEEQRSAEYWSLKPNIQPEKMVGPMAGGNIAYCSDSRCKHVYHIHDRFETQREYDSNW